MAHPDPTPASFPAAIAGFRVVRELGRGGMGEVYLAHDTRLNRPVAIKSLPAPLASDPDRLSRFQREAKVLASLNHPGIGAIYGLEWAEGRPYLILEYVAGQTLAQRLRRGPVPVREALGIAGRVAEALEAAHEKGVVHRDLKPGNVMVLPDGPVKVLDFGLARAPDAPGPASEPAEPATATSPGRGHAPSALGLVMGTPGYMSPEQARGQPVDKRSDIFSFGCLLYEMLTGVGPFEGETVSDAIGATLHKDVDFSRLPCDTPTNARHVLGRCLERDRSRRFRDIGDVRMELERAEAEPQGPAGPARAARRARLVGAGAAAGLALGAVGAMLARRPLGESGGRSPLFASLEPAPGTTMIAFGDVSGPAVLSPDGRSVAFTARDTRGVQALWFRPLDRAEPEALPDTDRAVFPFWSPDGRSIGFFTDGKLRRIDLATRATRTLCEAPGGRGGTWTDGGEILFSPAFQSGIHRVAAEGGEPRALTTVDGTPFTSHRWPSAVRGTNRFLYLAVQHDPSKRRESLFIASLDGTLNRELVQTRFGGQAAGGRVLFLRESTLVAAELDAAAGVLRSEPAPIVADASPDASTWHPRFSVSEEGTLLYHPQSPAGDGAQAPALDAGLGEALRATVVDRHGVPGATVADGMIQGTLAASPDGLRLAISGRWPNEAGLGDGASYDIWVFTLFGPGTDYAKAVFTPPPDPSPMRLTFLPGDEVSAVWAPDGRSIAFGKIYGPEPLGVFVKPLSGGGERLVARVRPGDALLVPTAWSRDGRYIVCKRGAYVGSADSDIVAIPVDGGEPLDLAGGPGEKLGSISNDNRWLAFFSTESGTAEVYVIPFMPGWEVERAAGAATPDPSDRYRVSIAGGAGPVWGTTGRTLFYISSSNSIVGVRWSTDGTRFVHDAGQAYFDFPQEAGAGFDVLPTDEYFVVNASLTPRESRARLVLGWEALLGR